MDKISEKVVETVVETVGHHRKLEEDLEKLESEFRVLKGRKIDINSTIEAEVCPWQRVKTEVTGWLEDVEKIEKDIEDVKTRVHNGVPFLERAGLDKLVREKIEVVKGIYERGIFNEGLVIARPPASGIKIPIEELEGEISTKGKIWEYLMGDEVGMIGVCGIGGVGKTTIMKHVNNDLLREDRFQKVIWVLVSYPLNVFELQKKIVDAMGERLQEDEEMRRAAELMDIMGRKSFVLILDDVWEKFSLKDVGIPEPVQNKSKVVITTRLIEVCKYLDCKIVKVQPLSPEESLNLFLRKVGHDVLQVPRLGEILKLIVKECEGLPLAIIVIAGSMKGEDDIVEWRNALNELRQCVESVKGVEDEIFERLRFSFDRLRSLQIQKCFLYCSLFWEDYVFSRKKLIEGWIDEGLIDELGNRQVAYDRGHSILNRLQQNCLLEEYVGSSRVFVGRSRECVERDSVKMHDVVRDMAIKRIGPKFGYMVKAGMKLTEVPNEHKWERDLEKVSLMANDISKIPVGLSPKCPLLSTLILSYNYHLSEIPSSFFEDMVGLKVLDLSSTGIVALPDSISTLVNLSVLQLRNCNKLMCLPSLANLRALKKLDLYWAGIEVFPQGMEMLVSLEYLNLSCPNLKEIPTGILPNLSSLQYLLTDQWEPITTRTNLEEIASLSKLKRLECGLRDIQDFNYFVNESKDFQSLTTYDLVLRTERNDNTQHSSTTQCERKVMIYGSKIGEECIVLPNNLERLWIRRCKFMRSNLSKALLEKANELRECWIENCEEIECVVELDSCSSSLCFLVLDKLEELKLYSLPNLSVLVRVEGVATPPHVFSNLKRLYIMGCSGMRKLLPLELLQALKNLEVIQVSYCKQIEEIISSSDSDASSDIFTLPKLKSLILTYLPQLKSICSGKGVMVCDSIEFILMGGCQKLKRIPLQLPLLDNGQPSPPPRLTTIEIHKDSKEWWESVEWDHPNAKNILRPFLKLSDLLENFVNKSRGTPIARANKIPFLHSTPLQNESNAKGSLTWEKPM